MPVSINMPNRPIGGEQKDPLEKLANAVNIAKSIYGIYADSKTLDQALADKSKQKELTDLQLKEAQRKEAQAADDDNPNSPLMQAIRGAASKRGLTIPEGTTPRQARTMFDAYLKPKEEKAIDPFLAESRKLDIEKKRAELNAKNQSNKEFQNRYQNILTQVDEAKKMIQDKGTFEALGPHNKQLQQRIDSIAIDAAKLFDPQSVARESEVAAFRNMLFEGGSLKDSNASAEALLDNFKNVVDSRAANLGMALGSSRPAANPGAEDAQAIQWAQANPRDPRAIKILQVHGLDKGVAGR